MSVLLALIATSAFVPVSAPAQILDCPVDDLPFAGAPDGLPATALEPVRRDPDGGMTLLLSVDDPAFGGQGYTYTRVGGDGGREFGVYSHRWPTSRRLVAYGLYTFVQGTRVRIPQVVIENGANDDLVAAAMAASLREMEPLLANGTPYLTNTVSPTPMILPVVAILVASQAPAARPVVDPLASGASMHGDSYPAPSGYGTVPTVYAWTTYRKVNDQQFWSGLALTHAGWYETSDATREGCRRTRIGLVTRASSGTTYHGGVFVLDHVTGTGSSSERFEAQQAITVGVTAAGADVPITTIHQSEQKEGASRRAPAYYRESQRDEITIGARVGDAFVPLLGTRSDATHGAPPNAQRRTTSLGIFDPLGTYRPVLGARAWFERHPGDLWPLLWTLSGGPGSEDAGDWQVDLGVFDPLGSFLPVAGATYWDDIRFVPSTMHRYQMMVTAGPWLAGSYVPALAATYDGAAPLVWWALSNLAGRYAEMRPWLASAGAVTPVGYVPVVGATYEPGLNAPHPVVEQYNVGTFAAAYPAFVPVAGARWSGDHTSAAWAVRFAGSNGRPSGFAQVDVGPVVAGSFSPIAGASVAGGRPERYQVGVWALGGFTQLLAACYSPGSPQSNGSLGAAVAGQPIAWVGTRQGSPNAGVSSDCPG